MAVQKKFALGRGLDALISTEEVRPPVLLLLMK